MTLTLDKLIRSETDPAIIATLLRKGWVENEPPAFNPATHKPPQWDGKQWVSVAFTAGELQAIAAAAADATERDQVRTILAALRAGTGTQGERITRLERVVAHLVGSLT